MSLLRSIFAPEQRSFPALAFDDWVSMFTLGGFPLGLTQTLVGNREEVSATFAGLASGAYGANGTVFALMLTRLLLFAQPRFQWQQLRGGATGNTFGNADLGPLENPWPGATTGDLLSRMIVDADLGGTAFVVRRPNGRLKRLRPDWVGMFLGSMERNARLDPNDVDVELVGIGYQPGGTGPIQTFQRDQFAYFGPVPDPMAHYRGMSWLTPIIRQILADSAATTHRLRFFENGATPNMIVKVDPAVRDKAKFQEWVDVFEQNHAGVANAYKTIYLGSGSDATVVGANLQQLDFKATQSIDKEDICAAARIHPAVVGLAGGLQGSSLNAGNMRDARRSTIDGFAHPYWQNVCGSLQTIIPPPANARLWYDASGIPFLAEDVKDAADVISTQMEAINRGVTAGFQPDAVVDAVISGDLRRLMSQHTGLYSVQLQPPTNGVDQNANGTAPVPAPASSNGRTP